MGLLLTAYIPQFEEALFLNINAFSEKLLFQLRNVEARILHPTMPLEASRGNAASLFAYRGDF